MTGATASRFTIGVDIGGTFTDVVVLSDDGDVVTSKAPTTASDLSGGVLDAIREAAMGLQLELGALLRRADVIKHGSTVATNALLTRTGATVGFITTAGFEDTTLIMRAVGRVDGLPEEEVRRVTSITKPEPLVPQERIRGVPERIDADGRIVVPLDLEAVRVALRDLLGTAEEPGVDAIAVSLLHSWRNPVHERAIRTVHQELDPDGRVFCSLGSDLSQVAGEYARANTAIANAFVGPTVRRYLAGLEAQLRREGFEGRILAMQGNGGLTSHARASPISTLQSGPAGGMLASATMSERLGHGQAITTDMGGTSFDVGIVDGGSWRYAEEPVFERFRMLQPIIDITSIGAGGGTIARVDEATGRLIVGPESAGARPGPACYGLGGNEPTVTDADVVLGYIDPAYFLGGRRRLDAERARSAIETRVATKLRMDSVAAAAGIAAIVDAKMSDLIRREVIRSGRLPGDFVLYAFGGAGPVHAVGYARDLGVPEIVVFPTAPVFSAFGVAAADVVHTRLATRTWALPIPAADLNADLDELEASLAVELGQDGLETAAPDFRRYLTLKFRRQSSGEEVRLPWDRFTDERIAELPGIFVAQYERRYGTGVAYAEAGLEITGLRVDAVGRVARPELRLAPPTAGDAALARKGQRPAWFGGAFVATPIYDAATLGPGARLDGPAIVESPFTTLVLPPVASLAVDPFGNLVIRP